MIARILTVLVLAPAVIAGVIYATPLYFLVALGIVATLCLFEYFRMVQSMGLRVQPWYGYLSLWLLFVGFQVKWMSPLALFGGVLIMGFLAAIWRQAPMKDRVLGLMANLLGIAYVTFFLYPAALLRFDFGNQLGIEWMMILFAVIWSGDSAALIVGKRFGRTPFAPALSPKKTNEGALGGLLAGIAAALLLQHFLFQELPLPHVIGTSLLVGIFSQLGDLAESMLKRAAEIKDSSRLIPGHGGVLDRLDSLLFGFPVLYLYLFCLYT